MSESQDGTVLNLLPIPSSFRVALVILPPNAVDQLERLRLLSELLSNRQGPTSTRTRLLPTLCRSRVRGTCTLLILNLISVDRLTFLNS